MYISYARSKNKTIETFIRKMLKNKLSKIKGGHHHKTICSEGEFRNQVHYFILQKKGTCLIDIFFIIIADCYNW